MTSINHDSGGLFNRIGNYINIKKLLLTVFCFLFLLTGVYLFRGFQRSQFQESSFDKVDRFNRPSVFLTQFGNLEYIYPSLGPHALYGDEIYSNDIPVFDDSIASTPDGMKFFVGADDCILEYDSTGKLLKRFHISDFGFDQKKFTFAGRMQASNQFLWIAAYKLITNQGKNKYYKYFVIEWDYSESPQKRLVSPNINPTDWIIDCDNRIMYIPDKTITLYCFESDKVETKSWTSCDLIDFDKNRGFLFSNYPDSTNDDIVVHDVQTKQKRVITKGFTAIWGDGDYIYFCKGSTQLWRCKSDATDIQPVYLASAKPKHKTGQAVVPKISHDRAFLSYFYSVPRFLRGEDWGMVLFDLKSKQYLELPEDKVHTATMEWLVKPDEENNVIPDDIVKQYTSRVNFSYDLSDAILEKDYNRIKKIIKSGANVNASDSSGYTPLFFAIQTGEVEIVKLILDHGASVDIKEDLNGDTPLHFAVSDDFSYSEDLSKHQKSEIQYEMTELLLNFSPKINAQNIIGDTPLHRAVDHGNVNVVNLLVEKGADPNIQNIYKDTPLHIALSFSGENYMKIARLIIKNCNNIDWSLKDSGGLTCLEKSRYCGDENIVQLLKKSSGAKDVRYYVACDC